MKAFSIIVDIKIAFKIYRKIVNLMSNFKMIKVKFRTKFYRFFSEIGIGRVYLKLPYPKNDICSKFKS